MRSNTLLLRLNENLEMIQVCQVETLVVTQREASVKGRVRGGVILSSRGVLLENRTDFVDRID